MPISIDAGLFNVVTGYFAYVALVSVAAVMAIVSLGFSANVAVGLLDRIVKPAFLTADTLAVPMPSKPDVWHTTTRLPG